MIVVEGFDGSGKSTIASRIAENLQWSLTHTGGPTQGMADVERCLEISRTRFGLSCVQDRTTHVSESVYSMLRHPERAALALSRIHEVSAAKLIVYCRPATAFLVKNALLHKPKEHETWEHVEWMTRHAEELVSIYDCVIAMASRHVQVVRYDRLQNQSAVDLLTIVGGIVA